MRTHTYHAPETLSNALELLASATEHSRPLAGGTDLLVQMRRADSLKGALIDVKRIPELREIAFGNDDELTLGAAVTCAELREHESVTARYPGLVEAAGLIGGTAVQGRATIGGNLCNASPSADAVPALMVLDATCLIAGPGGEREVTVCDFCVAPGKTVLSRDELLVALRIPRPAARSASAYLRFIPRGEMDIAVAGAAAWLRLEGDVIAESRVALSAVAPTPLLLGFPEKLLDGQVPSEPLFAEAGLRAVQECHPISDHRGSNSQRRKLVAVLVRRSLRAALERARNGAGI